MALFVPPLLGATCLRKLKQSWQILRTIKRERATVLSPFRDAPTIACCDRTEIDAPAARMV